MKTLAILLLSLAAEAHVTLWHDSLFGFNWPDAANATKQNYNQNYPVTPRRKNDLLTQSQWFGHGLLHLPPADGVFMELAVGKPNTFELGCNRALTTFGFPHHKEKHHLACKDDNGPLHNANTVDTPYDKLNLTLFGGTALGIAYTDDITTVQPTEFTIISVNYTSPWLRLVEYQIPATLPPCPEKGCLCTWNWMHTRDNKEGYGDEFYNTLYRCKVTGAEGNVGNRLAIPQAPVKCVGEESKCVTGAKQAMFAWMVDGNNVFPPGGEGPTYNMRYGFSDGAQDVAVVVGDKEEVVMAAEEVVVEVTGLDGDVVGAEVDGVVDIAPIELDDNGPPVGGAVAGKPAGTQCRRGRKRFGW